MDHNRSSSHEDTLPHRNPHPFPTRRSSDLIVEARVENTDRPNKPEPDKDSKTNGPSKILVGNPPLWDQADFERLSAQLKDRKSTRLNSSHSSISYAVFCLKKKK